MDQNHPPASDNFSHYLEIIMRIPEELDEPHYIDRELLEDYWIAQQFVNLLNPSHCEGLRGNVLDFHTRRMETIERILLRQDRDSSTH